MLKLLVLCIVPFVLAAPDKRFLETFGFHIGNPLDVDTLKCDVQIMLDAIGSDPTEKACEAECHHLIAEGTLFSYGCPLVCHAFQNLAHFFGETPDPSAVNATCGGLNLGN